MKFNVKPCISTKTNKQTNKQKTTTTTTTTEVIVSDHSVQYKH